MILGISSFKTPFQLYQEKIGERPETVETFIMRRGKELEAPARELYEMETGFSVFPTCLAHPVLPWLKASLDGITPDQERIVEIKCLGKTAHEAAFDGIVPAEYEWQCQHQLLVSGAKVCDYYSFYDSQGIRVEIEPNLDAFFRIELEAAVFRSRILHKIPPPLSRRDCKVINDEAYQALVARYRELAAEEKRLGAEIKHLKQKLAEADKHPLIEIDGLRIQKIVRKGAVDYSKIPALANIDVEKYRKPQTEYVKLYEKKSTKPRTDFS